MLFVLVLVLLFSHFFLFQDKKTTMITRSRARAGAPAPAAPAARVPSKARDPSPFFCLGKEKNERRAKPAQAQKASHPFSDSDSPTLRWTTCKLSSAKGPCSRRSFPTPCLKWFLPRLSVGLRFGIEWERLGDVQTSLGRVVSRPSPAEARVRYDNLPGVWPFPPRDQRTFVRRVALEKATPKQHTGLTPTALRTRISQYASVGGFVRLTFSKGGLPPQRWVGVVVEKRPFQCRIRWFGVGHAQTDIALWFPAPRRAQVVVEKVFFAPAPPPALAHVKSTALRRKQFTELLAGVPAKRPVEVSTGRGVTAPTPDFEQIPSKQAKTANELRYGFLTLNARSLTDDARIYAALALAHARGVGTLVLCETKRRANFDPIPGWKIFETPANESGQWGCAVFCHESVMHSFVRSDVVVPHRVVSVEFDRCVTLGVYAPTFAEAECQENVLNSISHFLTMKGKKRRILMGDFNARPLTQCRSNRKLAAASRRFTDFLLQNDLVASNVDFPGKGTPYTCGKATLDYIIVDRRFKSSVRNVLKLDAPFPTDHAALKAHIRVKWSTAKSEKKEQQHRPDLGAIVHHPRRIASLSLLCPFTSLVSALKPNEDFLPQGKWRVRWTSGAPHPQPDEPTQLVQEQRSSDERPLTWLDLLVVDPSLQSFLQSSRNALLSLPAVGSTWLKPTRAQPWKEPHIESLLALSSKMRLPSNVLPDAIDALMHHDAGRLVSSFAAHLKQNPRRAWDFVGAFRKRATSTLPALSPQDRIEKFHAHFSKLFGSIGSFPSFSNQDTQKKENLSKKVASPPSTCPPEKGAPQNPLPTENLFQFGSFNLDALLDEACARIPARIVWDTGPFRLDELNYVVMCAKVGRATGLDDIPNELLKVPALRLAVLHILNEMLSTPAFLWPNVLTRSVISPIPKKGDLSDTGNWRGIVLLCHLTKLYDGLLLQRLRKAVDAHLKYTQNGFRHDRSTVHHITLLKVLVDTASTFHDYPLHCCFVDFSKAFDSVYWKSIVRRLQFFQCPNSFIRDIFKVMNGHTLYVRTSDGLISDPISQNVGVLQGDTLAPYLFVLVLDGVLQKLPTHLGVLLSRAAPKQTARQRAISKDSPFEREIRLTDAAFADDIGILAHTSGNLQELFPILEREALDVGLRINMGQGKTERFCIGDDPGTVANVHGIPIPVVKNYKYLGSQVLDFEKEFAKRKACAWAAMKSFDAVWDSHVKMDLKRSLFKSLIDPIFTYAASSWSLTRSQMNEVDAAYGRLLRRALGLQPAFLSHSIVHTEKLYGELPFVTSVLAERRFKFCAHVFRATSLRNAPHALAYALAFDTSHLRPKVGQKNTFMATLARDARTVFDGLHPMFRNKTRSLDVSMEIRAERQTEKYRSIYQRRAAHMHSYFEDDMGVDLDTGKRIRRPPRQLTYPSPVVRPGELRPAASESMFRLAAAISPPN